jgi:hypothetical protein
VHKGGLFVIYILMEKGEVGVGPMMDELKGVGTSETFILHRVL